MVMLLGTVSMRASTEFRDGRFRDDPLAAGGQQKLPPRPDYQDERGQHRTRPVGAHRMQRDE
jgi:hypothetical protein